VAIARGQHLIGKMLGSCVLERLLGYGGTSAVFLARDQQSEQEVAVKVFLPRDTANSRMQKDFYRRFLHEAEAASKLDHPNILPIYAYGEEDGLPYIVMPYMEGGTLLDYMSRRGALSLHEAQWYLEQLTAALDYAHGHGCIHCDVKPANMLLDSEGRVMLSDFGIAHLMSRTDNPGGSEMKSSDAVMGTPDYVSPEQALGKHLDGCSDIYSLGITLFFLLAKKLPFKADTPIATALLHVHEPVPSLALLRADVSPALDRVVQKALAKDPARRFQIAGDFCRAFVAALANGYQKSSLASLREVSLFDDELSDDFFDSLPNLPIAEPVVRLRPLQSNQHVLVRLVILCVVCLTVLSVIGTTIVLLASRSPQKTVVAAIVHRRVTLPKDKLAYANQWPVSKTFFFDSQSRSYHVLNTSQNVVAVAPYLGGKYHDFHLSVVASEVHRTLIPGDNGYYGITFRASIDQLHYYLFEIAPDDGNRYLFLRYDGTWTTLLSGSLPVALQPTTPNTITIDVHGNTFTFWVNGTLVAQPMSDPSKTPLVTGQIGLCVEDQGTEVAFSQLYIDSKP
jgi:serine/threonine protein kinase